MKFSTSEFFSQIIAIPAVYFLLSRFGDEKVSKLFCGPRFSAANVQVQKISCVGTALDQAGPETVETTGASQTSRRHQRPADAQCPRRPDLRRSKTAEFLDSSAQSVAFCLDIRQYKPRRLSPYPGDRTVFEIVLISFDFRIFLEN
jgi:hypothetical protein